jgi:putative transposase
VPDGLELRTDHGPQYTGDDAHKLCTAWHVDHTFAPVGRPTGNAPAERFIETMKIEVIWTQDWDTSDELDAALQAWLVKYNHERPHQSLGWLTPAEKRALNLGRPLVAAA